MSDKYGSHTRSGEAVSGFGQRGGGGASSAKQPYEQIFTAPGTWTKPANVSYVDVIVVGGGGGSGTRTTTPTGPGIGGAGRVFVEYGVPVSAPVPVTVGAGGTVAVVPSNTLAVSGGDSAFGDTTPPAPPSSIIAGGGGPGGVAVPAPLYTPTRSPFANGKAAPPIGGGGGGGSSRVPPSGTTVYTPGGSGAFGYPGTQSTPPNPGFYRGLGGGTSGMYGRYQNGEGGTLWAGALGTMGYGAVEGYGAVGYKDGPPETAYGNSRDEGPGMPGCVVVQWWE